jgi:acyl dehydratase
VSESDRRGGERRVIARTSAFFYRAERLVYARVTDASPTGLGVRAPSPFRVGEELTVRIQPKNGAPGRAVELRVRVAWTAGLHGMGLELLDVIAGADRYLNLLSPAR